MKGIFVKDFVIGQKFTETFQVVSSEVKSSARGDYLRLTLRDRTGEITGNRWGVPKREIPIASAGAIVIITGTVQEYPVGSGVRSLTIDSSIERTIHAPDLADFEPCAVIPFEMLDARLARLIDLISDRNLKDLVLGILCENDAFDTYPAAKSIHHAVKHGLLQHTVEVAEYAEAIRETRLGHGYGEAIDRSLLIAGALLHDIAKIKEFRPVGNGAFDYGRESMIGHIAQGVGIIMAAITKIENFDGDTATRLLHIIVSHHGKQEFGSPVEPQTPEAVIVNLADLASAKLYIMWDAKEKHQGASLFARTVDGYAYIGSPASDDDIWQD